MKTLKILLLVLPISLLMSSCGGDDDPIEDNSGDPISMDGLQDEWTVVAMDIEVTTTIALPVGNTETVTTIKGTEFDYDLTFGESDWTTEGSYEYTATVTLDDMELSSTDIPSNNISGSGNYTIDGDEMIVDGSFFEIEENGMTSTSIFDEEQRATFEINSDDQLVFTQNETFEQTEQGFTSTSQIVSQSVWERK